MDDSARRGAAPKDDVPADATPKSAARTTPPQAVGSATGSLDGTVADELGLTVVRF